MIPNDFRYEDGCSEKLACKLGKLARNSEMFSSSMAESVIQGASKMLPRKYGNFARSFNAVVKEEDESSCQKECYRCISIWTEICCCKMLIIKKKPLKTETQLGFHCGMFILKSVSLGQDRQMCEYDLCMDRYGHYPGYCLPHSAWSNNWPKWGWW